MTTYKLRKYLEKGAWPLMSCESVKGKSCGDNYGDAECPFCDYVFCLEGEEFSLGDMCKKCRAIVTGVTHEYCTRN